MIAPATDDRVKLINARIVDVDNGCYFNPDACLIIQKGKIVAMPGLPGEPEAHTADAVIDLRGMAVIPGLFNTHCHPQFRDRGEAGEAQFARNLADCLDRGVTNIRDTLTWDLDENRTAAARIARGELRGPRIHQAIHVAPIGDTYAPRQTPMNRFTFRVMKFPVIDYGEKRSGVVVFRPDAADQEVRDAVDRAIDERGAAAIKFCDQPEHFMSYKPGASVITARQLEAAVDQATRRKVPTTMHNVTVAGFRQGVKAGVTSLAHSPMDGELTEADADLLLDSETYIEPTMAVAYYMSYSMKGSPVRDHPEIQRLGRYRDATYDAYLEECWRPELQKSHKARHEFLRSGQMKLYGVLDLSTPFRFYAPFVIVGGANIRRLVEHGAGKRLGCGNDSGASDCSPSAVDQELRMLDFVLNQESQPRFTPADALRCATIQSARAMGVDDKFGSIRPGKTADLAVLDGDPLRDLHLIGRPVQALFMDGKLVIDRCGLQVNPASCLEASRSAPEVSLVADFR
jgi:imidazolonepropionase-like amidohydrolase